MDRFAVWVERSLDANPFAFVCLYQILPVDIVHSAAGGIFQNVLVTRFHDGTRESLSFALLRLGLRIGCLLFCLSRRLSRLLLGLLFRLLLGLLGWLLRRWLAGRLLVRLHCRLLRVELSP